MSDLEKPDDISVQDCLKVIIVQQQRIYDVLLVLLANGNKEAFSNIVGIHKDFKPGPGPAPYVEE